MPTNATQLKPDPWLSERLGKNAFHLNVNRESFNAGDPSAGESLAAQLSRKVFMDAKVATDDLVGIQFLERLGFHLIDTNVVFDKPVESAALPESACTVRQAIPEDREAVRRIAHNSFVFTRFHLDPAIDREVANTIKADWAGNYFSGTRGDGMIVAEVDRQPIGFLLYLHSKDEIIIDLIAVDGAFRRRRAAHSMIVYAQNSAAPDKIVIKVGTQVANIASMRLYEQVGFRICQSSYVFHYHHD